MRRTTTLRGIAAAAVTGALALGPAAFAHDTGAIDDGVLDSAEETHAHHDNDQHGGTEGHLDPVRSNVEVVGKGVINKGEGRVADVGVHKGYAYLTAFREPKCQNGGVAVMDIRDVENPKQITMIPSSPGTYAGEGSQVITIDTPQFSGDVLAFNNEICDEKNAAAGGMTLVDVSDPRNPKRLVEHAGDLDGTPYAHSIHSVFMWDAGDKAYAALVDNEESADVDIMDISNPSKPVMVAEYDLTERGNITQPDQDLDEVFRHDMVVKQIDGRWIMLASYWDGGYVTLDVTNPAKATLIADSDFATPDSGAAAAGLEVPPEGNAHQAEFTRDNKFILAADEDFSPFAAEAFNKTEGKPIAAAPGSGKGFEPGEGLTAPSRFTGLACEPATVPPAGAADLIAVVERGVCSFSEKIASVSAAGYDAAVVFNNQGTDSRCSTLISMLADDAAIPAFFVSRATGLSILNTGGYNEDACEAGTGVAAPAPGTGGDTLSFSTYFDGWGYVRLFSSTPAKGGKLKELDTYALPETHDQDFAEGFGDLSVHEIAVSESRSDLAYVSYYAGGLRVIKVVPARRGAEVREVGSFIDEGGNNFWGVQVFSQGGKEYVAASDRDAGLYILEYTGGQ